MRYKKLGVVLKKPYPMWEFNFNYSLLSEPITEVFVVVKSKRRLTTASTRPGALAGLEDAPTTEEHAVTRPAGDA